MYTIVGLCVTLSQAKRLKSIQQSRYLLLKWRSVKAAWSGCMHRNRSHLWSTVYRGRTFNNVHVDRYTSSKVKQHHFHFWIQDSDTYVSVCKIAIRREWCSYPEGVIDHMSHQWRSWTTFMTKKLTFPKLQFTYMEDWYIPVRIPLQNKTSLFLNVTTDACFWSRVIAGQTIVNKLYSWARIRTPRLSRFHQNILA